MSYDAWKTDDSPREFVSRCDCCHRVRYGCIEADFERNGELETWHVCPTCQQFDDPMDAYVDPDHLRDARAER